VAVSEKQGLNFLCAARLAQVCCHPGKARRRFHHASQHRRGQRRPRHHDVHPRL